MSIRNVITQPPVLPLVAPSILSADFSCLADECRLALEAGADLLHLDVMDGHFVPNLTMGPWLCQSLRQALPGVFLDVHLMVTDPAGFITPFADAGADHFTFHVEANGEPIDLAERIHASGMTAGLAINPPTPLDAAEAYVEAFDLLLVMSVNPGYSGQSFIPEVLGKTSALAKRLRPDQRLEMDGGVNETTVAACRDAGCDLIVAASAIFGTKDYRHAIRALRGTAGKVAGSA